MAATAPLLEESVAADPVESAKLVGLRYVTDRSPGIRRRRTGKNFSYTAPDGSTITDREEIRRIKAIGVPPAWADVWICPNPRGHLQATGRDARRRKQYRYHPKYRSFREDTKFYRLVSFAEALPRIRKHVLRDLNLEALVKDKVLATIVQLLDLTLIRVGNDEYAKANDSFGLTTMREDHVAVAGTELRFRFRGKSGKEHHVSIRDRRLAGIVRRFQDLPGEELFNWVDGDGNLRPIDSGDANDYIRDAAGSDFTAKDFRTWTGTVLATTSLLQQGAGETERERKRKVVEAVNAVSQYLGNTAAIARKSYIHPIVIDSYMDNSLFTDTRVDPAEVPDVELRAVSGLRDDEELVLRFLKKRAESESSQQSVA